MKMLKRVLLGFVPVVLLMLFAGVAVALPPRITWTPNPLVTESITPGESATYTVTFKNTGYLPIPVTNQLRVVPEGDIAKYVTVVPPKFPSIVKRGQSVTFDVAVMVPGDAPVGVSDGTLVLKRVLPNGKVKEVWRAEALYAEFTFSPIPLPPDPGEAGKITIEGIDLDGDGVRDDVQRWIVFNAYTSESGRAALMQYATALQDSLTATSDDVAIAAARARRDSIDCLYFVRGDKDDSSGLIANLRAQALNTPERSRKYIADQSVLSGVSLTSGIDEWQYKCRFDPWKMDS